MENITEPINRWKIHRSTSDNLEAFARSYNATLRGWIEHYGKFGVETQLVPMERHAIKTLEMGEIKFQGVNQKS